MKIFNCPNCNSEIYFENTQCSNCRSNLGFGSDTLNFSMVGPSGTTSSKEQISWNRYCANFEFEMCNWLVENNVDTYCTCCRLNGTVPDISDAENHEKWKRLELAKHRLVYQLLVMGRPIRPKSIDPANELIFNFLGKDNPDKQMTGHADGVITILLNEADSVEREQLCKLLSEPYRTLIGHFRHEIGHYYWPYLVTADKLQEFRSVFGDESLDYGKSLKQHYENGAALNW